MPQTSDINQRIDDVLRCNRKHEVIIIIFAIFIFVFGISALIYGMVKGNVYIAVPATIISGCLYWPINEIKKIRKDNIALAVIPTLITTLPPDEAARELVKLLAKISK